MGLAGKLTMQNLAFSIPSDGPLYPSLPYHYQNASVFVFEYETDGDLASKLLPAQAQLTDPPTAGLVFAKYPSCTLGPYNEVVVFLNAIYSGPGAPTNGQPLLYAAHLYVTTDVAMAAGREIAGFPKKLGVIGFQDGPPISMSLERPAGQKLVSATFERQGQPEQSPSSTLTYLTLRMMPSPTLGAAPSICNLLTTDWVMVNSQIWTGQGQCAICGSTPQDPLNQVPVLKVLSAKLIQGDLEVAANDRDRSEPF